MPMYDYKCSSCGSTFVQRQKISERLVPESNECPHCAVVGFVTLTIGAPLISYSTNPGLRTTDNFNSRLQEISSTKGSGCTIDTRRSV